MKNTTTNPLVFVIKYNNQTKVYEILAYPYDRQRMQTYLFSPKSQLCHTSLMIESTDHTDLQKRPLMMTAHNITLHIFRFIPFSVP